MSLLKRRAGNMQVVYVEAIAGIKNEEEGIVSQVWKKRQSKVEFFGFVSLNFQAAFAHKLNGLLQAQLLRRA